jgi:hypothetical protein
MSALRVNSGTANQRLPEREQFTSHSAARSNLPLARKPRDEILLQFFFGPGRRSRGVEREAAFGYRRFGLGGRRDGVFV